MAVGALAASLISACASEGPPRGSLMVVVDTNVTPGRDFDLLRVRVQDDPSTEIAFHYGWDEAENRAVARDGGYLPFTVNVQNARETLTSRRVSVAAWKGSDPVFVRDAELVLPASGTKALRLTVESLCFPPLAAEGAKPVAWPERDWAVACAEGQTCFAGACASSHVDGSALEDYAPERVYGGAPGPGQGGTCADVLGCFTRRANADGSLDEARLAQVVTPVLEYGECTLDVRGLGGAEAIAVALELPPEGPGVCGANGCVASLDRVRGGASGEVGWSSVGGRLTVPRRVCDRGARVLVRTQGDEGCTTKVVTTPACGETSSLGDAARARPRTRASEKLIFEGGGDGGIVCPSMSVSRDLCGRANAACGEVLMDDERCGGHGRYAQCRTAEETTACPSTEVAAMKRVPGGTFLMGSTVAEVSAGRAFSDELPQHAVTVREFWLDETEVTAGAFEDWCAGDGSETETCRGMRRYALPATYKNGLRQHPMNGVSWLEANAYCAAHGKRLPTEEEWEYAARGGSKQYVYPWGNDAPSATRLCWARSGTCPVGSFPGGASVHGVLDLAGSVSEWTSSRDSESYRVYRTSASRVYRGGGWGLADAAYVRSADRNADDPAFRVTSVGFRCAR